MNKVKFLSNGRSRWRYEQSEILSNGRSRWRHEQSEILSNGRVVGDMNKVNFLYKNLKI